MSPCTLRSPFDTEYSNRIIWIIEFLEERTNHLEMHAYGNFKFGPGKDDLVVRSAPGPTGGCLVPTKL